MGGDWGYGSGLATEDTESFLLMDRSKGVSKFEPEVETGEGGGWGGMGKEVRAAGVEDAWGD